MKAKVLLRRIFRIVISTALSCAISAGTAICDAVHADLDPVYGHPAVQDRAPEHRLVRAHESGRQIQTARRAYRPTRTCRRST